jgi:hypothetical protein
MQFKFFTLAVFTCLLTAVAAAPGDPFTEQDSGNVDKPSAPGQEGSGSTAETLFKQKVDTIKKNPEVQNTLDFLVQQIAAQLNEHSP